MTGVLLLLIALALEVVGCNKSIRPAEWPELRQGREAKELRVLPRSSKEVADLNPGDIVRICRHIGLSDEEILTLGTDLRNALRSSGAAVIAHGRETKAIFRISGNHVFVRTPFKGSFVYDFVRGEFGLL
jgi:hypothetical protein